MRDLVGNLCDGDIRREEPAARQLQPGQSALIASRSDAGQIVGDFGIEERVFGQRARSHDPRDFAFDEPLGLLRIFDLLADCRPVTGPNQLLQVAIECVIREARHRDRIGRALVPAGQSQPQHPRSNLGVLVEQLIKIAHPKQQQRPRILGFHLQIPLHHRRDGTVH